MSRFRVKQKLWTVPVQFTVTDETGTARYTVQGPRLSLGRQLHVSDPDGREVAALRQKIPTLLPKYIVDIPGMPEILLVREWTLWRPRYTLRGLDWTVEGDVLHHAFTLTRGLEEIARVRKQWGTLTDEYEVEVSRDDNDLPALMVVLALDCALASAETATAVAGPAG